MGTLFIDIDGVLLYQNTGTNYAQEIANNIKPKAIPGTIEKFKELEKQGCDLILTTARKESSRFITEKQLSELGIFYDQLIMGISTGKRYLINDAKPDNPDEPTAIAITLQRNQGIKDLTID